MEEATRVAPGGAMAERQLLLAHLEARANRVDRHPHLAAEPRSEREARFARGRRERALTGERLAGLEAAEEPDQLTSGALRDPETAALARLERGNGQVGAVL